jgi:hypothetical protein
MTTKQMAFMTRPATDAQKNMITKLRDKKCTPTNPIISNSEIAALLMCEVDAIKNKIFAQPWPAKTATPVEATEVKKFDDYADIIDGNYAYAYNGKTHFYRVTRQEGTGKWSGRTFINVQERASDELFKIYDYGMKKAVLTEIRKVGISTSQKLFAEKLGRCWRCGKTLTDEFNPYKSAGLGPDCGTKV